MLGTNINEGSKEFKGVFFFSGQHIESNKFRAAGKSKLGRSIWDKFQITLSDDQQLTLTRLTPWYPSLLPPEYGALKTAINEKYGGEIIASSSEGYLVSTNLYDAFTEATPSSVSWNCSYFDATYGVPYGLAYKLKNGKTVWEKFILFERKHIVDTSDPTEARHAQSEATFHYTSANKAYILPEGNTLLAVPEPMHSSVLRLKLATGEMDKPHPSVRVVNATQVRAVIKTLKPLRNPLKNEA